MIKKGVHKFTHFFIEMFDKNRYNYTKYKNGDIQMSKINNNIKFYTFIDVLSNFSDEDNSISIKEINEKLDKRIGITLNRRTIYSYIKDINDIYDMKQLGLCVTSYDEETGGYHFIGHKLEEYEIKILVDAISSSKFITKEKTDKLIDKLYKLNSVYISIDSSKVFIANRSKSINEEIFINIDKINRAIREKKQISFNYYDYNFIKKLVPRLNNEGNLKVYTATPVSMILKNENYYLVLASNKHSNLSNYRIDRMKNINILDEDARCLDDIKDCKGGFNVALYSKKSFKMFTGEEESVDIKFNSNLLNFMIDEFGDDIEIKKNDDGTYNGRFMAKVGKGLARWILQLGKDAVVLWPSRLKEEVREELVQMVNLY